MASTLSTKEINTLTLTVPLSSQLTLFLTRYLPMTFFRQYIAPLLIVLVFLFALVVVSARIFLPSDLAAPAPIEDTDLVSEMSLM